MRVDHLLEDEFLFELDMRQIVIRDDPTFTRRRRSLRESLKVEKEDNVVIAPKLSAERAGEIGLCDQKYREIWDILNGGDNSSKDKCKTRLLHLGHRLFQMMQNCTEDNRLANQLSQLLIKCVLLLRESFYTQPSAPAPGLENDIEPDLPIGDLFVTGPTPPPNNSSQLQGNPGEVLNNALVDQNLIHSLLDRIRRLEDETMRERNRREISTQTVMADNQGQINYSTFGTQSVENPTFSTNVSRPNLNPIIGGNTYTAGPSYATQFTSVNTSQPPLSVPRFSQNPPQPSHLWSSNVTQNLPPTGNNYPSWNATSRARPVYNSLNQIPGSNAVGTSLNPGQSSHRTLPVSRWTLAKYDGEDHGLKLNEFLEVVQALSMAEHVSEAELFESAVHLFKGHALNWYMTMRTTGRLLNWQHLVLELRRTFMHPDLDALIKMKIYQRRQLRNEPFNEYYYEMERLFRTMSNQIPDYEKMQILLQNMRIDYKKQLTFVHITDLATLVAAGQKVDALNFSAYNKVFGTEKQTNAISVGDQNPKVKKSGQQSNQSPDAASQPNNRSRNKTSNNTQNSPSPSSNPARGQPPAATASTLEALIDSHCPPPTNRCFNCGMPGHTVDACRCPRAVLCENCGFRGYPTNNCPYCIKNAMSVGENRGSLHP